MDPRVADKSWTACERIVFREPVSLPAGVLPEKEGAPPKYDSNEKIVGSYPRPSTMMAKQHYHLWVDKGVEAILEHPRTGEREFVPWTNVQSYRPKGETDAAIKRVAADKVATAAPPIAKPAAA